MAEKRLKERGLTLSIVSGRHVLFETSSHGISGFLRAVEEVGGRLEGASVADKIVGRAVALLCVYAGIEGAYASVMSRHAKDLLEKNAICVECDELVESILDDCKPRSCPFEKLAGEITDPAEAYKKLKALQDSFNATQMKA